MSEVEDLVAAAMTGEEQAWARIVERYSDLVWAIARSHRLNPADAADVSQTTWLRLVEHLSSIRNPASVGSWIATTARRECLRMLRLAGRQLPIGDEEVLESHLPVTAEGVDERILKSLETQELWAGFQSLSDRCRTLLRLLTIDPPPSYEEASAALDMPVGSIGPTRARCIERLKTILGLGSISTPVEGSS